MSALNQLREQFPDFWFKAVEEPGFIESLLDVYAIPYAYVSGKLAQIQNSYSIRNIDYFVYDYYFAVDCKDASYTPSSPIVGYSQCFEIEHSTFHLENLSYDSFFTRNVLDYKILYDKVNEKYFLAIADSEWNLNRPSVLFAEKAYKSNKSYPFRHFFEFAPIEYKFNQWTEIAPYIFIVPENYDELERIRAQYGNMMYASVNGGSPESLESLFGVAFGKTYAKDDGTIVDYDETSVYVNHSGVVTKYSIGSLRNKFKVAGAKVRLYECFEESPIRFVTWNSNPTRFTQILIGNRSQLLSSLIGLKDGEKEGDLVIADDNVHDIQFDMGGKLPETVESRAYLRSRGYSEDEIAKYFSVIELRTGNSTSQPYDVKIPLFREDVFGYFNDWFDIRYGKYPYAFLKNIIIWETELTSEYYDWILSVLANYKPLAMKFVPSPVNGIIAEETNVGYGKKYGQSYGGGI